MATTSITPAASHNNRILTLIRQISSSSITSNNFDQQGSSQVLTTENTSSVASEKNRSASSSSGSSKVCLIVGAGDATGSALARKFHKEGFKVACVRRQGQRLDDGIVKELGEGCRGFAVDARKEDEITNLFKEVETDMGEIEVCIHNIGGNVRFPLLETTERVYRKVWELCGLSAFLVGREAAKYMVNRGTGTIIFTGATASTRGAANFAAFSGGMHAKRSLAQSMAREFGPKGIHVAHVIIDGPIETNFTKGIMGEATWEKMRTNHQLLSPPEIAQAYWTLVTQHKSAWTFEMDLRPYSETF
jgi:NAD(P)-dependent dehydrogenase (short-subunit alcohol dehydrogenase family)